VPRQRPRRLVVTHVEERLAAAGLRRRELGENAVPRQHPQRRQPHLGVELVDEAGREQRDTLGSGLGHRHARA
jgi:hypothetical protein